ncbi:hypothetical protein O181_130315 [Austropuccinia psidii MF-1]|uniref:Uncharacterized protein n=1 Tax=Austropuccinia psidii MF-1 TaxID=1389203 RepID=A0A9Q3QAV5_9BASI|nr:hypothetical protein [Austropuccinia psidii MF-1]
MTPTGSAINYNIQSNRYGPGHSSHKSKRQECQPRGEAQMKDARTSTSFQRLARTFDTLIESPEADIIAIAVHVIRGPEEEVGPREGKKPSRSSPSLHKQKSASTSARQAQATPKDQPEGQSKGKGKGKAQVEQALPAELQDYQEREDSHAQCVQYGKNAD